MPEKTDFDILIIGSGASGVQTAAEAIKSGLKVGLLDIGITDQKYATRIPPKPFLDLRKTDPNQSYYFLGENIEQAFLSQNKAGAHLTAPRSHMIQDMEKFFPVISNSFFPLQSTALGGLGVSWGANVFVYEDFELKKIGIHPQEIRPFYQEVAQDIGVSGNQKDDVGKLIAKDISLLPPLQLDSLAVSIYKIYQKKKDLFTKRGFSLGQSVLANLTLPSHNRQKNPYWDMDFWSDFTKSVYRPQFTLEILKKDPNFYYLPGQLALFFKEKNHIELYCQHLNTGEEKIITTKKLILAAGALGSAKIVLKSFENYNTQIPILCNHNLWVAAIHLPLLGKLVRNERYSLAQLTALLRHPDDTEDYVLAQFYSYRSLLLSRLLLNIPLPPKLGLLLARLILTSFTCVNLHFSDSTSPIRNVRLKKQDKLDALEINYEFTDLEKHKLKVQERKMLKQLLSLYCVPMGVSRPAHGASIHYAGTLPYCASDKPLTCTLEGRLRGTQNVYVADGSTWNFLPAKGLTFTLMANARRVARFLISS